MQVFEEAQRNQLVTVVDIQTQAALDDYQVQLSDIANPTQSQDNVVIDRFGEFLPHWNESLDFDTWVKMSMEVAGKRLLILRGDSNVSSASSGSNTFTQYHGTTASGFVDTLSSQLISDVIFEANVRATAATHNMNWGLASLSANEGGDRVSIKSYSAGSDIYGYCEDGVSAKTLLEFNTYSFTQNQWYKLKITNDGTTVHYYFDDIEIESGATTTLPNDNIGLQFHIQTGTGEQEFSFARKYSTTEPTLTTAGGEQNIAAALKSLGRAG